MMLNELSIWTIEMYILLFFTYSFAGWFMESVGGILNVKKFVNRGFLIGPYCPVYGCGVVLITFLLGNYTNDIPVLFILSTLICGVLEYFTSYMMEKLFNARWWDYHNRKFNINGRVCLETLIPFGIGGSLFLCVINPFFINLYSKIPDLGRHIIVGILMVSFIIDVIISFIIIFSFKGATYKSKDNTEEISNMVKDKTEDMIMKVESDAIVLSRKMKVRRLKLQRKVKYTRKQYIGKKITRKELYDTINKQRIIFVQKLNDNKEKISNEIKQKKEQYEEMARQSKNILENSVKKRKDELEVFQKNSKIILENRIQTIRNSSEEFNKQVKENFKNKSILNKRLMDAFPNLEIKTKKNKEK